MWWYNRWDYIISLFSVFFLCFFFRFCFVFRQIDVVFCCCGSFQAFPCYFGRLGAFRLPFYTTVCCVLTLYVQCLGSTLFVGTIFVFLGVVMTDMYVVIFVV